MVEELEGDRGRPAPLPEAFGGEDVHQERALSRHARASAGVVTSVFVTSLGAQRWILPRLGLEVRAPFTSIPATAYFAGAALLGPSSNVLTQPRRGLAMRAGVAGPTAPVAAFLEYHLERLTFEPGAAREEQRGEVRAGVRITPYRPASARPPARDASPRQRSVAGSTSRPQLLASSR
jgi:hypothetical protein